MGTSRGASATASLLRTLMLSGAVAVAGTGPAGFNTNPCVGRAGRRAALRIPRPGGPPGGRPYESLGPAARPVGKSYISNMKSTILFYKHRNGCATPHLRCGDGRFASFFLNEDIEGALPLARARVKRRLSPAPPRAVSPVFRAAFTLSTFDDLAHACADPLLTKRPFGRAIPHRSGRPDARYPRSRRWAGVQARGAPCTHGSKRKFDHVGQNIWNTLWN